MLAEEFGRMPARAGWADDAAMTAETPPQRADGALPHPPSSASLQISWAREATQLLREAIRDWGTTLRLAFLFIILGAIAMVLR